MSTLHDLMLARDEEKSAVQHALANTMAGNGHALLFEGAAGIGKSRLIREAKRLAAECGAIVLSGRGVAAEEQFTFGLVRQLFEQEIAGSTAERTPAVLAGAARLAEPLFSYQEQVPLSPTQEDAIHAALHGLYWLCINLSQRAPLVLLVDDVHLADLPSQRFLHYLANRLEDHRVLVVATARSADVPGLRHEGRLPTVLPGAEIVQIQPLGVAAVRDICAAALNGPPVERFAEECHRLTAGNPLLLRELLAEPEVVAGSVGLERLAQFSPVATTRRLRGLLDGMWGAAGRLAQVAAVFGDGDLESVAHVAGMTEEEANAARRPLIAVGVLDGGTRVQFTCQILRNVAYAQLSSAQRRHWHLAAAQLLAARGARSETVAGHLLNIDNTSDPWVADALLSAADEAVRKGAMADAATFLRQALGSAVAERFPIDRLTGLAYAERCVRDPQAVEHLRTAFRIADGPYRTGIGLDLSAALVAAGRHREAIRLLERLLGDSGDDPTGRLSAELATVSALRVGTWHKLHRVLGADQLPDSMNEPSRALRLQSVLHALAHGASALEGVQATRLALAAGQRLGERDTEFPAAGLAALIFVLCDHLRDAEHVAAEIIRESRGRGMVLASHTGLIVSGVALLGQGRVSEAEEQARAALSGVGRGTLLGGAVPFAIATVAAAALHRGDPDTAEKLLDDTGFLGPVPDGVVHAPLLAMRGRLRLTQGRLDEALTDLRRSRRQGGGVTRCPPFAAWPDEATVLMQMDNPEEAKRLCRRELDLAQSFGAPTAVAVAVRTRALIEGGPQALDRLQHSAALLAHSTAAVETATTLIDLGAALRRTGQRSAARRQLKQGLELADNCGAAALSERALVELTAAGARRTMNRLSGGSLTPSELRVAAMAASGLRNQEIARRLFVTIKTVEWHLSQVYRKLGITSRRALEIVLDDTEADPSSGRRTAS